MRFIHSTASIALFLALAGVSHADPIDVVFLVDTSNTMAAEFPTMITGLADFDQTLTNAGHDVAYGLITFADVPTQQTPSLTTFANVTTILNSTTTSGGIENGSLAASLASTFSFRPGAYRMLLLVSDEADSGTAQQSTDAIADMQAASVFFLANLASLESSYIALAAGTGAVDSMGSPLVRTGLTNLSAYDDLATGASNLTLFFPPPPSPVPILGSWGIAALLLGLLGAGALTRTKPTGTHSHFH